MFGLLKNKLASFISGLSGREEKKAEDSSSQARASQDKAGQQAKAHEEPKRHPPEAKIELEALPEKESRTSETKEARPAKQSEGKGEGRSLQKQQESAAKGTQSEKKPGQVEVQPPPEKKSFLASVAGVFSHEKKPGLKDEKSARQGNFEAVPESQPAKSHKEAKQETQPATSKKEPGPQAGIAAKKEEPKPLRQDAPPGAAKPVQVSAKKPAGQDGAVPSKAGQAAPKSSEEAKPAMFAAKPQAQPEPDWSGLERKAQAEKREMAPKIGLGTAIKSFFSNEITIGEAEVADLLEELELSLLEADVAYEVSSEVASQLRSQLVGMKVPKGQVEQKTKEAIQRILESVMESDRKFDFVNRVKGLGKPAKILFVGPNGAGKTTTMAKIARMLMDSGLSVVFAASDTFRAAAIEQTEVHGGRLGVKTIKSKYGADPASVAFDAINYARASKVDVVLIDSAGRQDTNANLLSELVKINRVAQPDLKIYVGESIGGNSVIDQIKAFNTAIGMDGAILTKIDCDAKGGTAISIAKSTGIPVLFLGIGQGYADLVPFDAHKIASEIMN